MDRRRFFALMTAGIAGVALEQAIPFGRVWSFPSKILIPELVLEPTATYLGMLAMERTIARNAAVRARQAEEFFRFKDEPEVQALLHAAMAESKPVRRRHIPEHILSRNRIMDYRKVVLTDT